MSERQEQEGVGEALLREEPTEYDTVEAVDYWLRVYGQLITLTEDALRLTAERVSHLEGPGRRHVYSTNLRLLQEELGLFRERQEDLRRRRNELVGGPPDDQRQTGNLGFRPTIAPPDVP